MVQAIQPEYERRRARSAAEFAQRRAHAQTLLLSAGLALMAVVYGGYLAASGKIGWGWTALPMTVLIVLGWRQARARREAQRARRLLDVYKRGLGRMDGRNVQSGHRGEMFAEPGHLYARDLNVLGQDSLFGMLATTRTAVGQRALAGMLLRPADAATVRARQAAVRELAPLIELRERVALLGQTEFAEVPAESFDAWIDGGRDRVPAWARWVLSATTIGWMLLLAAAFLHWMDWTALARNVAAVLAVQGALALWLRPRVMAELEAAQKLPGQTAILRAGLSLLGEMKFKAELLTGLQRAAQGDEAALSALTRMLMLVEQRAKEWNYAPGLLMAVGTHAAISLSAWRVGHGQALRRWVAAWAEFDALLAVATYAAEHAENAYPEMAEGGVALFAAKDLRHPLLPRGSAVPNDLRLDAEIRFLLVSGSNMAGKSTLLRAIGCNVVLAHTGAPVCARAMTMSALRVGASMSLVDSLAENRSKFLAEVERLRDLLALAKNNRCNMLFLIDEIFSGTNSADRGVASEAVVRKLIAEGAVGAVSTHDLALTQAAEGLKGGVNVHMASAVESEPLGFDYLLKPGPNRTTNALAIVRMLGLVSTIVED